MSRLELFKYRLRLLRQKHHMSQRELARRLNSSQRLISYYETGISFPKLSTIVELAKVFNVDAEWLCGLKE